MGNCGFDTSRPLEELASSCPDEGVERGAPEPLKLMIPGPVDVEEDVLREMASPSSPHYGEEWIRVYNETIGLLRRIFQTEHDLFLMPGPGSAALDAAFGSLLATGEEVLIFSNGFFGERLVAIAENYGLRVKAVRFPWGSPLDPDAVRRRLAQERGVKAVAMVHHETSTTVLNPLQAIAEAVRERGLPLIVDAVSSLGGVPLPVDEWGVDLCVTVSNKCLEAPPGLAAISVSPRAWESIEGKKAHRAHGWYLNLSVWREYATRWAQWHPYPTTVPTQNILALRKSLKTILHRGLETHFARYRQAAERVREGLKALGFRLLVEGEYASPLTTAVLAEPLVSADELRRYLKEKHGILIASGLGELRGRIFRVGHMGKAASPEYVEAFLRGVEDYLGRSTGP